MYVPFLESGLVENSDAIFAIPARPPVSGLVTAGPADPAMSDDDEFRRPRVAGSSILLPPRFLKTRKSGPLWTTAVWFQRPAWTAIPGLGPLQGAAGRLRPTFVALRRGRALSHDLASSPGHGRGGTTPAKQDSKPQFAGAHPAYF